MSDASPPPPPRAGQFLSGLLRDWGVALALVILAIAGYNFFFAPTPPELGPAPDFTLAKPSGEMVTLSKVASEVVVLNFWFTSCPPCRAEIPELTAWAEAHPEIPLYGVSTDVGMPPGRLEREAAKLGIRYPVLHDVRAEVAGSYGVDVFPTTLVLKDGAIVSARVGGVNREILDGMVAKAR
jgi:cytochrome c biogenesis protein CcmG, thiol:disulfide interchange protein DsbE